MHGWLVRVFDDHQMWNAAKPSRSEALQEVQDVLLRRLLDGVGLVVIRRVSCDSVADDCDYPGPASMSFTTTVEERQGNVVIMGDHVDDVEVFAQEWRFSRLRAALGRPFHAQPLKEHEQAPAAKTSETWRQRAELDGHAASLGLMLLRRLPLFRRASSRRGQPAALPRPVEAPGHRCRRNKITSPQAPGGPALGTNPRALDPEPALPSLESLGGGRQRHAEWSAAMVPGTYLEVGRYQVLSSMYSKYWTRVPDSCCGRRLRGFWLSAAGRRLFWDERRRRERNPPPRAVRGPFPRTILPGCFRRGWCGHGRYGHWPWRCRGHRRCRLILLAQRSSNA